MQTSTAPAAAPALEEELAALGVRAPIYPQAAAASASAAAVAGPHMHYTEEHFGNGVHFGNGAHYGNGMDPTVAFPEGINLEEAR